MLFLRVKLTTGHERKDETNKKKSFYSTVVFDEPDLDDNNLFFVQWYKILDRQKLAFNYIDQALGRIWLYCQRTTGKYKVLSVC